MIISSLASNLFWVTMITYLSMLFYCAALGYVLGYYLDVEYDVQSTKNLLKLQAQKRLHVTQTVSFFIFKTKWLLLLFPALFSSTLFYPKEPLIFLYSYTSTMLLHLLIGQGVKKFFRDKNEER